MCPMHASQAIASDQILDDKSVFRKVWIERDEIKQIQKYVYLRRRRNDQSCLLIF